MPGCRFCPFRPQLIIWIPILFGCGAAIYKTVKGTIAFNNLNHALTSIVLIVMPLTWGIRAWIQVKDKEQTYQVGPRGLRAHACKRYRMCTAPKHPTLTHLPTYTLFI